MKTACLLLMLTLLAALGWINHRQRGEIATLTAQLAESRRPREATRARPEPPERNRTKASAEGRVSSNETTPPDSVAPDGVFDNVLEVWIGRARRLSRYLEAHPERKIPQLSLVTPQDWLEVTKDKDLISEADYREALGRLRAAARQKTAPAIGAALRQAMAANNGAVPDSPQALAPFLPANFDPALLQHLAINPSGEIDGLREIGGKPTFFLVDVSLDLWDGTNFYAADGGSGSRSVTPRQQSGLQRAIVEFTRTHGSPPTDFSQLATAPEISAMNQAVAAEIFQALTTKPDL